MKIFIINEIYYLKSKNNKTIADIIYLVCSNCGMKKHSFAERYTRKIISDLLLNAVNLRDKYIKYYKLEYDSFEEFLYQKESLEHEQIKEFWLNDDETIWKLQYSINSYKANNILGYDGENLEIINKALEMAVNEN